jgi:Cu-Zn family superoxide dismutase
MKIRFGKGAAIAAVAATMLGAGVSEAETSAHAIVVNKEGEILGTLALEQTRSGVVIRGQLDGLPPGTHAIHIHDRAACQPTFAAAGEHFNPSGREHGLRNPHGPHAGDLPNITVDANGRAFVRVIANEVDLGSEGPKSLLAGQGTAIVVHDKGDDYVTDPSGNSGDRIACGVVTAGERQ